MPDVGVLNLQIRDNSMQAAQGLSRLANVLKSIKESTTGLRLTTVATGISKIQQSVAKINNSDLQKLKILTSEIQKLQAAAGGVNGVRISFGSTKAGESTSSGAMEQAQAIRDMARDASTAMEYVGQRIQQDNEQAERFASTMEGVRTIIQNTGWTAQATAEQFAQMFQTWNAMRQSSSLGPAAGIYGLPENGFVMGEGTVTDAVEPLRLMAGAIEEVKDATHEATAAKEEFARPEGWGSGSIRELVTHAGELGERLRGVHGYVERIKAIKEVVEGTGIPKTEVMRQLSEIAQQGRKATEEIRNMMTALNQNPMSGTNLSLGIDRMMGIGSEPKSAKDSAAVFASLFDAEEKASAATEKLKWKLHELADALGISGKSFTEVLFGAEGLRGAMSRMFPTISGLLSRFKQLVKYRMLRAIIKQISEGFREGYENYYHYSEAIGSSFAPAMDSATSSLLQMKNSIGAAVAPLMQSLVPVLQTVVNWFITAVNYANQFIALMRGQSTWSRAVPTTAKAFETTEKAAKGASSAMKDLLADWDELNIIQSQGGGGGSSTGADAMTDYLNMFEEVSEFDSTIRDAFSFIHDNISEIKDLATAIGAMILGWKVSKSFGGVIGALGKIAALGGSVMISLELTDMFSKEYVKTGQPGWFIADALTGAIGSVLAWRAAKMIGGTGFANIAAGITLSLMGKVNLQAAKSAAAQAKDTKATMLRILGSVEIGIGAAMIAAGFSASTPIAVAVGAGVALYEYAANALVSVNITGIQWGDETLSNEQVSQFVQSEMLGVDVDAQINVANATMELASSAEESLRTQATSLLGPINALRLGIDVEGSLKQIYDGIIGEGGLLQKFRESANANKELIETAEAFAPTFDATGENVSEKTIGLGMGMWSELTGLMDDLGADLTSHFTKAMDKTLSEDLRNFEMKAVGEISDVMIRVASAGATASTKSDALSNLAFNLEDASKGTIDDILDSYDTYITELQQNTRDLKRAEASSFASAAAKYTVFAEEALKKAGGNEADEMYQYYVQRAKDAKDSYDAIILGTDNTIKDVTEHAGEPAKELFQKAFRGMLETATDVQGAFKDGKIIGFRRGAAGGLGDAVQLELQNIMTSGFENLDASEQKRRVESLMLATIKDLMPTDYDSIKRMIDLGLVDYSDIFGKEYKEALLSQFMGGYTGELTPTGEAVSGILGDIVIDYDLESEGLEEPVQVPSPDMSGFATGLNDMTARAKSAVDYVISEMNRINGIGVDIQIHAPSNNGGGFSGGMKYYQRAEGGFVRSGDLVMADENGRFEMMGRMGNQPVVANNEQIVTGISRGVSVANDSVVSALNVLIGLAQRIERKEMVAKVVPGTGIGRVNQQSADMFSRVTGV